MQVIMCAASTKVSTEPLVPPAVGLCVDLLTPFAPGMEAVAKPLKLRHDYRKVCDLASRCAALDKRGSRSASMSNKSVSSGDSSA
jgi:hypothetical protein